MKKVLYAAALFFLFAACTPKPSLPLWGMMSAG